MNNVVVMFLDGKEVFIENAYFITKYDQNSIVIGSRKDDRIIAIFNFNNIAGVRAI